MRVLVVSEDEVERLRAVSALRLHAADDVEVVEVASGAEANEVLRAQEPFDVLVIDGDLYPRGGFALLYTVRANADFAEEPSPPAVILAGRDQDRWLADWAGANAVLIKPVAPFQLARAVDRMLGEPAARHGATESSDQVSDLVTTPTGDDAGLAP